MNDTYELVMGLETHARIKSPTKMFCSCKNSLELDDGPNTNVCPVCMGFPGALPTLSEGVVDLAVRGSHAMRLEVQEYSEFDRKSYFYPDSPIAYQITQMYSPIAKNGKVKTLINGEMKEFRIEHMHIEADAGKLTHTARKTLCDYNRAVSPLMEIVTEPDFRSKEDVMGYLQELQKILRFSGASDADMEKGQLRCDVNISIRKKGETTLRNRVEIKNMNSFSEIGRAIDVEFKRQVEIYESGGILDQETRWWKSEECKSYSLRSKEDAMDYRYFPEPDLPPLILTKEYIDERQIPELPMDRRMKYFETYKLSEDDARILSTTRDISDYFEAVYVGTKDAKKSCSYVTTVLSGMIIESNEEYTFENNPVSTDQLISVINLVNKNELSSTGAKTVLEEIFNDRGSDVEKIMEAKGLKQNNDLGALESIVDEVLKNNPSQIEEYKWGKENLFGFFVGQCMKASRGQGNPKLFTEILKKKIG